jgi:hypothetical protein
VVARLGAALVLLTSLAVAPSGAYAAGEGALSSLVTQSSALPSNGVGAGQKSSLADAAREAKSGSPCQQVRALNEYRSLLGRTTASSKLKSRSRGLLRKRLAGLQATSLAATRSILISSSTKGCGGGVKAPTATNPKVTLLANTTSGIQLRVLLPAVRFVPEEKGGKSWVRLQLPNTESPSAPGTPNIPAISSMFAIPDGATPVVTSRVTSSFVAGGVQLFPAQDQPADQGPGGLTPKPNFGAGDFLAEPFKVNAAAYRSRATTPGVRGKALGQARDLNIGGLTIPLAQYSPGKRQVRFITGVDIQVKFTGGSTFSPELASPWEAAQRRLVAGLVNREAIKPSLAFVLRRCGEEMMVITNPSTRAQADTFASARRAAGLRVSVFETGAGSTQIGTTATQIQTAIRARLNSLNCIRPSYVTIIGDDELVPTFTTGPGGIPSDNPYSTKNDTDELPDVAVGRILGDGPTQLSNAITKIVNYETTAPTANGMLNKAAIAAQFQDTDEAGEVNDGREDRTFVQFAETARNGLVGRGVAVDRIYEDNPTTNPLQFNDGTNLPAALKKPSFAWDGDGADVSAAWNQGRFMIVHRDHGWSDGWGDPFFTTTEVDALTNGDRLPVVLSINCASAQYDTDETSFTQNALVKANGGAVGVFGDTRNSPSWHNSQIALGFIDAMLPSVLGGEGPVSKQRVGDALVHGKLRLAGLAPPSGPGIAGGDGNTRNELYLWHYFGDPSMQMWGGGSPPIILNPALFVATYKKVNTPTPDPPPYIVEVTLPKALLGQPVSLLRKGEVIGKAIAGDGIVQIPASFGDDKPAPGELQIALEADGAQPVQAPVGGVPAVPTTLTQTCPTSVVLGGNSNVNVTVTGKLADAPAGSTVKVTFTKPQGQTVVVEATTAADGTWSATTTASPNDSGTWKASSKFDGTSTHAASSAPECTFSASNPA